MEIAFELHGKPATQGSKRAYTYRKQGGGIGARVEEHGKHFKSWRALVVDAATEAYDGDPVKGPMVLTVRIIRQRPASHFGTGRNVNNLKPSAIYAKPVQRPDSLKICRGIEDALSGVVWVDDSQIIRHVITKEFGPRDRTDVCIELMTSNHEDTEDAK